MRQLLYTLFLVPLIGLAQEPKAVSDSNIEGIHFEKELSWAQVLERAKTLHRFIFVDCYTSWCGPCKMMEANVYPVKEVGQYFNVRFISVKVQMDRTSADDDRIKSWYGVAHYLENTYNVNAYPTFLFFDSSGKAVHKVSGTKSPDGLIGIASDALMPEKQYFNLVKNFEPGKIDTGELKSMSRFFTFSDKSLARRMAVDYLNRVPRAQWSSTDNQELMTRFQEDSTVQKIIVEFVGSQDKEQILDFIAGNFNVQQVRLIGIDFIMGLRKKDFDQEKILAFMQKLKKDDEVRVIARKYLDQLPEKEILASGCTY